MEPRARRFVDGLRGRGRRSFTRQEAERALVASPTGAYQALRRLQMHGALAMPRRGFYVVVDPEYRELGAPPATLWIDDLMRFLGEAYYVGLLSAAALHGAAHQRPMELQVVAGTVLRPLTVGRVRIRFFYSRHLEAAITERMKTASGYIPVSTAEMTAYDLIRYRQGAGSIDHVATVLAELAEKMDGRRLLAIARKGRRLPTAQRLGYLLDLTGHATVAGPLHRLVERASPRHVRLEPRSGDAVFERNERWRVLVNTTIEVEV